MSCYVYVLLDPRTLPEKPFYIGVSNYERARWGSRALEHYKDSNLDESSASFRNHAKSNLIKKLNRLGYEPCYRILDDVETIEQAYALEKYYIKRFGREDIGTGILYNKTFGGETNHGMVFTEEMRHKASLIKRKYPSDLVDYCLRQRFHHFLTAKQISELDYVREYGVRYQQVQAWIEGRSYKEIASKYPTIAESNANLCLQVHLDILSGKTSKEIKSTYNLSNGTYFRIKNFDFRWSAFQDYVSELISIGGNL